MYNIEAVLNKRQPGDSPKRNHHTAILNSLEIQPLQTVSRQQTMSLFSRIFRLPNERHLYNFTGSYALQLCAGTILWSDWFEWEYHH